MEAGDLRRVLRSEGVDLWALIETAIAVAARDHGKELRARRDGIVERLYAADRCRNCDDGGGGGGRPARREGEEKGRSEQKGSNSPAMKRLPSPESPPSMGGADREEGEEEEEEEEDHHRGILGRPIDAEQRKILGIKEFLEDPDQSEESLVSLLQNLADMDITFKALKETDIGRHVNGLRKHPSAEVRRLVKQLVRKWKDLVDEWVKSNSAGDSASPANITDGDSPLQTAGKSSVHNGHQVPEFGFSPNPQNGNLSSERTNGSETIESKPKAIPARRVAEAPTKPAHSTPSPAPPAKLKEQKDSPLDAERLASARRRLHENYQEAQNAKKQRTIQVMDIHEIPKPKNSFPRRGGHQGRHW